MNMQIKDINMHIRISTFHGGGITISSYTLSDCIHGQMTLGQQSRRNILLVYSVMKNLLFCIILAQRNYLLNAEI